MSTTYLVPIAFLVIGIILLLLPPHVSKKFMANGRRRQSNEVSPRIGGLILCISGLVLGGLFFVSSSPTRIFQTGADLGRDATAAGATTDILEPIENVRKVKKEFHFWTYTPEISAFYFVKIGNPYKAKYTWSSENNTEEKHGEVMVRNGYNAIKFEPDTADGFSVGKHTVVVTDETGNLICRIVFIVEIV